MHAIFRTTLIAAAMTCAAQSAFANVITDWDEKAVAVVTPMAALSGTSPYAAMRMLAMAHAAMFDAVNSIERRYRPYLVQLPAAPTTSKEAAAAAAAAAMLATVDAKITELRRQLGVRGSRNGASAPVAAKSVSTRRPLSAAARKRIAAAQKKRWAAYRKSHDE